MPSIATSQQNALTFYTLFVGCLSASQIQYYINIWSIVCFLLSIINLDNETQTTIMVALNAVNYKRSLYKSIILNYCDLAKGNLNSNFTVVFKRSVSRDEQASQNMSRL